MLGLGCWAIPVLMVLGRLRGLRVPQECSRVGAHLGGVAVSFCLQVCVFLEVSEEGQDMDYRWFVLSEWLEIGSAVAAVKLVGFGLLVVLLDGLMPVVRM